MIQMICFVCETFFLNYLMLKSTALLSTEKPKLLLASTALSTALSIFENMFIFTRSGRVLFLLGTTIWYICITFKFSTFKKFVKLYLLYLLMLLCYGGASYFVSSFLLLKSHVSFVIANICVFAVTLFLSSWLKRKRMLQNFCYDIQINHKDKKVICKAFLDSGNLLVDPNTNKPVSLVNFKIFSKLFGDSVKLEELIVGRWKPCGTNAYYIPFNTLNCEAKILVFEVDEIKIDGKLERNVEFGLSLKNFTDAFGSDVILNNAFA